MICHAWSSPRPAAAAVALCILASACLGQAPDQSEPPDPTGGRDDGSTPSVPGSMAAPWQPLVMPMDAGQSVRVHGQGIQHFVIALPDTLRVSHREQPNDLAALGWDQTWVLDRPRGAPLSDSGCGFLPDGVGLTGAVDAPDRTDLGPGQVEVLAYTTIPGYVDVRVADAPPPEQNVTAGTPALNVTKIPVVVEQAGQGQTGFRVNATFSVEGPAIVITTLDIRAGTGAVGPSDSFMTTIMTGSGEVCRHRQLETTSPFSATSSEAALPATAAVDGSAGDYVWQAEFLTSDPSAAQRLEMVATMTVTSAHDVSV